MERRNREQKRKDEWKIFVLIWERKHGTVGGRPKTKMDKMELELHSNALVTTQNIPVLGSS